MSSHQPCPERLPEMPPPHIANADPTQTVIGVGRYDSNCLPQKVVLLDDDSGNRDHYPHRAVRRVPEKEATHDATQDGHFWEQDGRRWHRVSPSAQLKGDTSFVDCVNDT